MVHQISERQRWLWLLSGLSVCIAARGCGLGWLWVLAGGFLTAIYYIYMDRTLRPAGLAALLPRVFGKGGKAVAAVTLIWTVLLMAWAAGLADAAFPMVDGFPALGWVMLALAAWGSRKGAAACARCAGVLCLFLLVLYGVVVIFAVPDVQLSSLRPLGAWTNGVEALGLCLLPASVWYVPCKKSRKEPTWGLGILMVLAITALVAVTAGVLSPALAAALPAPLYMLGQSVSLFGVLERIEPLLSVAMTMGVFCLLSSMACACQCLGEQVKKSPWIGAGSCVAAGVLMGAVQNVPVAVLTAGMAVFMVAVPLMALRLVPRPRNSGKTGEKAQDTGR